ncbi:MAG: hypothetical protein OWU84_00100 [Firmicutes bacterium]|nr:hypothetical protein [Bacillota bacterium]
MRRGRYLGALSVGALTLMLSTPVAARTHMPLWDHGFETVSAVTPSTVVIKHSDGVEQQVGLSQVQVRASVYPAPAAILKPGERVSLWANTPSALVVVHPSAVGTLVSSPGGWQVATKHRGVVQLSGAHPLLLGLKQLAAGERVLTFGPRRGESVEVTAVAARPLMVRTVVEATTPERVTLASDQYGTLTYTLGSLPASLKTAVSHLAPGQIAVACLNPLNRQVLMVFQDPAAAWAKTLERGSAGEVVAVSPKDLTLTNHLGTVTIPLNMPTEIEWPGHPRASATALTPGTRIVAVRESSGKLKVLVLSPTP